MQGLDRALVLVHTRPIRSLRGNAILKGSVYNQMLEIRERKLINPIPIHSERSFLSFASSVIP